MYYRVEINNEGVYEYAKKYLFDKYGYNNVIWKKILDSSKWLVNPEIYSSNTYLQSWWTEKGFEKFNNTLDLIKKYIPCTIDLYITDDINTDIIVYEDEKSSSN